MCSNMTTDYHGEQEKSTGKKILFHNFYRCLRLKSLVIILGGLLLAIIKSVCYNPKMTVSSRSIPFSKKIQLLHRYKGGNCQ